MSRVRIEHGDCREVIKTLADCSVDSCVTDPPYSLVSIQKRFGKSGSAPVKSEGATGVYRRASSGFMGQSWDTGETAFDPDFWAQVWRVLKPGAHVLAFSGTRTYHRMACAIEDAGFEIRDQVGWLYGSGFPKSHNAGNGWGTALKPAWEPICLARKPLSGTVAETVMEHGTGALNIDACRIETSDADKATINGKHAGMNPDEYQRPQGVSLQLSVKPMPLIKAQAHDKGRWPANVIHDGSPEVERAFEAYGEKTSGSLLPGHKKPAGTGNSWTNSSGVVTGTYGGDTGSASRFFYSAKADAEDRLGSKHPTVKPVDLIAYLARLVTPRGGLILDPFAGTGTLGAACMREGFRCILIEREAAYVADIKNRIDQATGANTPLFAGTA